MALIKERGTIASILEVRSGRTETGKQWQRQQIVLAIKNGDYINNLAMDASGDDVDALQTLKKGDLVDVAFYISSRAYNNKWYTQLNLTKISLVAAEGREYTKDPLEAETEDLPF